MQTMMILELNEQRPSHAAKDDRGASPTERRAQTGAVHTRSWPLHLPVEGVATHVARWRHHSRQREQTLPANMPIGLIFFHQTVTSQTDRWEHHIPRSLVSLDGVSQAVKPLTPTSEVTEGYHSS